MEIKEIKEKLSILTVLDHYGIKVSKNRQCLCPFHDDKNPSMQVYPETNTVHCFSGNCEHGGKAIDQIDFILHHEKCTKHEAILKAKTIASSSNYLEPTSELEAKQQAEPVNHTEVFKALRQSLSRSKTAQSYLNNRNLTYEASLEIGFKSGNSKAFKGMNNCLIFPLKNANGEIVSFYGRSIKATGGHYYQTNRSGLYPSYPSGSTRRILLTESVIDALTLKVYLKYTDYTTLALYGTNGLTPEHTEAIQTIKDLCEVTLFLDGDEAGRKDTEKHSKTLNELLPEVKISQVGPPEGEDINSLVQSHEPEILTHLLENRISLYSSKANPQKLKANSLNVENPDLLVYETDLLLIRVLGGVSFYPLDKLKVTLKIELKNSKSPLHKVRQTLDMYYGDQNEKLIKKVSERLELGTREVEHGIYGLIEELENYREEELLKRKTEPEETLNEEVRKEALKLLSTPNYLETLLPDLIEKAGVVGERKNGLILWVTYATRKRKDPLHVICLGASGTGKTYLQEKISDLIPEEEKVNGTAISENALYYAQNLDLRHKLFIIEDLDGASNILYALRELQTKKLITKMVTQKDSKGKLKTDILKVEGPICLTATTTKEKLYEDNANRCLLIYLDNTSVQQEAIMENQRKRSAGLINKIEMKASKEVLTTMQQLYEDVVVRNPYAEALQLPPMVFKPLRINSHYLNFIEAITYCNQFQRLKKMDESTGETYIETTVDDIKLANDLLKEVLLAKSDELSKACRNFYEGLKPLLLEKGHESFYRQDVREVMRINPNNLKYYLKQLTQYGYLRVLSSTKKKGNEYEIVDLAEYERLNGKITSSLDKVLKKLTDNTDN